MFVRALGAVVVAAAVAVPGAMVENRQDLSDLDGELSFSRTARGLDSRSLVLSDSERLIGLSGCNTNMCYSDGGSMRAGQMLTFAALNRSFKVTKEAAKRSSERKIDLGKLANYGRVYSKRNGNIFIRYGNWEARLNSRSGVVMTVVLR